MPEPTTSAPALSGVEGFARPYVVSWNLTYRCNLACEHCYLDAGGAPLPPQRAENARRGPRLVGTENFADRSELGTEECFRVIDEIAAFAPECVTILTGGEPLLRRDILEIVRRAAEGGLWVVVGTNGVSITENLARRLAEAGARGLSLSLDALDPDRHDRFRMVRGAWRNTVEGAEILNRTGLPFIVRTTAGSHNLGDLDAIADFAHDRLAAKVWNLYFLVPTGRGQFVSDITPAQYDEVLASLYRIQRKYDRRMLVNAKCAPHYIKTVLENAVRPGSSLDVARDDPERVKGGQAGAQADPSPTDARLRQGYGGQAESASIPFDPAQGKPSWPGSSPIRTYSGGAGGCPAGTHYMGIRPNGDVTPCPYLPVFAGALRRHSPPHRARWAMRGVRDERPLWWLPRPGLRDDRRSYGGRPPLHPHPRHVRRISPAHASWRAGEAPRSHNRVWPRVAGDHCVGRCGRRADEEDPRLRPRDGRQGRRGFVPQERHRSRHGGGAGEDPRANADAEDFRLTAASGTERGEGAREWSEPRGSGGSAE